jgi:hypothetical protein
MLASSCSLNYSKISNDSYQAIILEEKSKKVKSTVKPKIHRQAMPPAARFFEKKRGKKLFITRSAILQGSIVVFPSGTILFPILLSSSLRVSSRSSRLIKNRR